MNLNDDKHEQVKGWNDCPETLIKRCNTKKLIKKKKFIRPSFNVYSENSSEVFSDVKIHSLESTEGGKIEAKSKLPETIRTKNDE